MQDGLIKKTAVLCLFFTVASMGVMLYYAAGKVITVTDVAQDEVLQSTVSAEVVITEDHTIPIKEGDGREDLCIPLPESIKPEEVTVENHYMDQELWVSIKPENPEKIQGFYEDNAASADRARVLEGHFEEDEKQIILRFRLDGLYEYQNVFRDSTLRVSFLHPKEVYDKVLVIDAAYGGAEFGVRDGNFMAKDVTLGIARELKSRLDETEMKVYYTRMDDSYLSQESRSRLAELAEADMLIRIEAGSSEDTGRYGTETVCNSRYFIPEFDSVKLADILEREVVTAISGKAAGLMEAGEEDAVVKNAVIPAAAVRVGYLTNEKEAALLRQEAYQKKIAEGIYHAILTAYEQMDDGGEE